MIHRTILVKKDENGFGLRVSSDNPVYVESVKPDGAAWKAGVRSGDQIIKVNGHVVTNYNHQVVVKMIQNCGHQVVLTLEASSVKSQLCNNILNSNFLNQNESINNSNSLPLNLATSTRIKPHTNSSNCLKDTLQRHITPPIPANDHTLYEFEKSKVETIRKMLGDEKEFLNKLRKEDKNLNEKEIEIKTTIKRIKQLEKSLSNVNDHSKQAVARYIVPLDTSFANLRLSSSQKSTKTSSNSSINLQQNNSYSDSVINNISRKHLSAENLHFFTQLSSTDANATDCQTKKSHSFGQYDHLTNNSSKNSDSSSSNFYTSYSDIQTPNNSSNSFQIEEQEYNPNTLINCKPSIDILLEPANVHLLMNFLHYLLVQKQDINPLLFYILTDLFKKVCENPKFSCLDNFSPLQYQIRKWAFEIYSTFLFNDSPLRLNCDISKDQNQFSELLNENFTSTSNLVNTIFDPFLDNCKDQINNQIDLFKKQLSNGLNTKKINPTEIIECLIQDLIELPHQVILTASSSSTLLGQIRILISYLLNNLKFSDSSVVAIAQLTCFTSIIYHCFPYFLISSDENANVFAKLIELPVPVYLSFHQTHSNHPNQLQHKRHKSLPASSNQNSSAIPYHLSCSSQPTGNYNSNQNQQKNNTAINNIQPNKNQFYLKSGHIFSLLDTTKPNNCSGCNQSIWAMFGWHCQLCLLISHHWCLRSTAEDHHCPGPIDSVLDQCNDLNQNNINNLQHLSSTISSASSNSRKSKNAKSTGGRLFENILKNRSESLKQKKEESKICCRKKSDPSLCSTAFNDFSSIKSKFTQSPSSSSDSDLDENQFNQNEHSFSIFNDNLFNRDDQNLIDFNNDSKYVFSNSSFSNLPMKNSSAKLSTEMKKASKRQDIFKELISTERTHVKNLKILNDIFYVPIYKEQLLNQDQIDFVFSNHTQLYDIHSQIYYMLKIKKKEQQKFVQDQLQFPQQSNYIPLDHGIGQLLVHIFEGDIGKKLEEAASVFCARQTIGGDILRNKLKKDSRLSSFLTEAEANKCCRRLQLKDMLASCFQRITKYPLLMENLMKEIEDKESEEFKLIERACKRSKSILSTVNECVKQAENKQKLLEIHRKTEKFYINDKLVNFDFSEKILLYEGFLTYRVVKKTFEVLVLLCKDVIIFLLKEGDKFFFKNINKNTLPIVEVKNVITRKNATDSRCFYLISSKDGLMYELVAASETEKNNWVKQIDEAAVKSGGEVRTAQIKLKDLTSRDEQNFLDDNKIKSINDHDDSEENLIKIDQQPDELKSTEDKEQDENIVSKAKIDGTISYVKDEDLNLNRKNLLLYQPTVDYAFSYTSRGQTIIERNQAIDIEIERLQNKNFIIDTEIERLQNEKFINDTEIERLRNEKLINARV